MRDIKLKDFCADKTQAAAAEIIGCTQGAISQMIKDERDIYIVLHDGQGATSYERKKPGQKTGN